MIPRRKILICGAGVAGPACAWWLHHYGFDVVVAERSRALRDGGQNVDIKGAGQTVITRMGLSERIEALGTRERGQKFVTADGRVIATLPRGGFACLTADYEILRGDLVSILVEATYENCEYRFGTAVAGFEETANGIHARFTDGSIETFTVVIYAEGIGSATRSMVLPDQTGFRHLGAAMASFRIPARAGDDGWAQTVHAIGGTYLILRPGHEGETTVLMTFPSGDPDIEATDSTRRRAALRRALMARGSVADRIADGLDDAGDIYVGLMSQVHAPMWSKGRFVLLGDAAYCPTPFTGSGCALALVGSYVLAGEISRHADHVQAFACYEASVRPYVEAAQRQLSPFIVRLLHPRSRFCIALAESVERLITSWPVQALLRRSDADRRRHVANDFVLSIYFELDGSPAKASSPLAGDARA